MADLTADTTVTVGISYAGAAADVTCTGGGNNNGGSGSSFQVNNFQPGAGCQTASYTTTISGSGFVSGATVTIAGTACTSPMATRTFPCTAPAPEPGPVHAQVEDFLTS